MATMNLNEDLPRLRRDEASWVDVDTGLRYVFNGGHTVNIWAGETNVDVFTFGDFARDQMTAEEAEDAIRRHLADSDEDA